MRQRCQYDRIRRALMQCSVLLLFILPLLVPSRSVTAAAAQLLRYPYLTDVVDTYATINWATDISSSMSWVTYGDLSQQEACTAHRVNGASTRILVNTVPENQWMAQLTLHTNTQYCYRVFLGVDPGIDLLGADPSPTFWTQIVAGDTTPFSFAVFGDWGQVEAGGNDAVRADVMRRIAESGVRFAVTTGDNGYPNGSQATYGDLVQSGVDISAIFGPQRWTLPGRSIPLFPILGNHGFASTGTTHPHIVNWPQNRAVNLSNGSQAVETYCCRNGTTSADYPSVWYAFDAGTARFYMLEAAWSDLNNGTADPYRNDYDYHWRPGQAEYNWLKNDLATHPSKLKFAFFHYPMYSDNNTEVSDPYLTYQNDPSTSLEALLSQYGVNMSFSGHAHVYQRNLKATNSNLITYITGVGGSDLQSVGPCSIIDIYGIGWSDTQNRGNACGAAAVPQSVDQVFHFLRVTVNGTTVTVTPTDSQGRIFDQQTYDFSSGGDSLPPTTPTGLTAQVITPNQIDLAWNASSDNIGVQGYMIRRSGSFLALVSGDQTSYSDTSARDGVKYTYTVRAFDAGANYSAPSNNAAVTTPDVTAPTAPANLKATVVSVSQVNLVWSPSKDNLGVTGYVLTRDDQPLATLGGATTSYSDLSVAEAQSYTYRVQATDAAGNISVPSMVVALTPDVTPPSAPTNLRAQAFFGGQVLLNWLPSTDNVGVTSYLIRRNGVTIVAVDSSVLTYVDRTANGITNLSYTVRASDAAGNVSQVSAPASARPPQLAFLPLVVR